MIKFIVLALFMTTAAAEYDYYDEPMDGMDGSPGMDGLNGANGANGSDGDSYGAGFGLITQIYDPDYKGWQSSVGASQFDGDTSYMFGTAKDLPHGILNINVGSTQGKQGAGAAWSFKY